MIHFDVVKDFDKACAAACDLIRELTPLKEQLVAFANGHERRSLVLNNLCQQVHLAEVHLKQKSPELSRKRRNLVIAATAEMFMKAIKLKRDQDLMTEAQKVFLQRKQSTREEMAQLIREVPSGETQEKS